MDIYKGLLVSEKPGPEVLNYNGDQYFRYMDRLYIPRAPAELSKAEVLALSEIRIKLDGKIIDYDYSLIVIQELYKLLGETSGKSIIDFGCGGGMISNIFASPKTLTHPARLLGLDICEYAVNSARSCYVNLPHVEVDAQLFDEDCILDETDCSFDGVISSFVMHFNIYPQQIRELYRLLKPGSKFVYNDYVFHKYRGHAIKTMKALNEVGFEIESSNMAFKHPITKDVKNHRIVVATK